tara:strand:- start:42034 stop:43275 length:1242 start_codon:yes stop_codon:yes gene_type:complete
MTKIISIECKISTPMESAKKINQALKEGMWVEIVSLNQKNIAIPENLLPQGPGIIIGSSGSTGGPQQCLHPFLNLQQSAFATKEWLLRQNIEPKHCQIINTLPIHHTSGLMAWWRSLSWEANHKWINPNLMKNPFELEHSFKSIFQSNERQLLTSLVPTQLIRLLKHSSGIKWLQSFSVIWVGGSSLSPKIANIARKHGIRLAPCYGATETMAMVTALTPEDFLKGGTDSGCPLIDVELRLGNNNALEVRTPRLAIAKWVNGQIQHIVNKDGWWQSGDYAEIILEKELQKLTILGRLDNAINSGGETIFPDKLQDNLLEAAQKANLPIEQILLTSIANEEWGERIVALVRFKEKYKYELLSSIIMKMKKLVDTWPPAERPIAWYHCEKLKMNDFGKWEYQKWQEWITTQTEII